MHDVLARFAGLDPLGIGAIAGCLVFLLGLWKVISDPIDLSSGPQAEGPSKPADEEPRSQAPTSDPRSSGGRAA
jgi:hypothetical protein